MMPWFTVMSIASKLQFELDTIKKSSSSSVNPNDSIIHDITANMEAITAQFAYHANMTNHTHIKLKSEFNSLAAFVSENANKTTNFIQLKIDNLMNTSSHSNTSFKKLESRIDAIEAHTVSQLQVMWVKTRCIKELWFLAIKYSKYNTQK